MDGALELSEDRMDTYYTVMVMFGPSISPLDEYNCSRCVWFAVDGLLSDDEDQCPPVRYQVQHWCLVTTR